MTNEKCGAETTKGTPCQNDAESCPWHNTDSPPDNGRDSKLTKEREEQIAQAIERGKSINSAARMSGISPQTVYNWLDRGEDESNTVYADFFERITSAKGYGEDRYFNVIWELAKEEGDHRFLASLMKQRYPDSWDETETGVDANQVEIEVSERVRDTWPTEQ